MGPVQAIEDHVPPVGATVAVLVALEEQHAPLARLRDEEVARGREAQEPRVLHVLREAPEPRAARATEPPVEGPRVRRVDPGPNRGGAPAR